MVPHLRTRKLVSMLNLVQSVGPSSITGSGAGNRGWRSCPLRFVRLVGGLSVDLEDDDVDGPPALSCSAAGGSSSKSKSTGSSGGSRSTTSKSSSC